MILPFGMLLILGIVTTNCRSSSSSSEVKSLETRPQTIVFSHAKPGEIYSVELAKKDFASILKGIPQLGRAENITVDAEQNLVVKQNQGKVASTGGGAQILIPIAPTREITVEYKVFFDGNGGEYDWTWGGKLPGVGGGVRYFGGKPANAGDGFSARYMFGDKGKMFAYIYHKDMPGTYGDPVGISQKDIFRSNTWHQVKLFYKVNEGEKANGILRAFVDGRLIGEKLDLRYTTNDSPVDTLHIPLFHGGGSPEYFPEKDQFIKLRELTLEAKPIPNGNRNQEETQEPALDWQI